MEKNRFMDMSDGALEKVLKDYSTIRKGEISDLAYAASVRIGVLSGRVRILEDELEKEGDDMK